MAFPTTTKDANADWLNMPWQTLDRQRSASVMIGWSGVQTAGAAPSTATFELLFSNDADPDSETITAVVLQSTYPSSGTLPINSGEDALLWVFDYPVKRWKVRYNAGDAAAGQFRIAVEEDV